MIASPARSIAAAGAEHGGRLYLCDPLNHCIDVVASSGRPLVSFGSRGCGLGQFDGPADLAIVWLDQQDGEPVWPLLAIADRGNHRIQLLETDGVPVAAIEGRAGARRPARPSRRRGWPYFRLADAIPSFVEPVGLAWAPPVLAVSCADGSSVRIDLALSLLPDFDTFLEWAPATVLQHAVADLAGDPARGIPDALLLRMLQKLHPAEAADPRSRT